MAGMLRLEPLVVRFGDGSHRVRYLPKELRAGRSVALELHGEYLGQPFGFAASGIGMAGELDSDIHVGTAKPDY